MSRTHAQLELVGDEWTLVDDGLSRNGSFVNGERVAGRRRLADGDVLLVGQTALPLRDARARDEDHGSASPAAAVRLTEAQRRVLVELCRPLLVPKRCETRPRATVRWPPSSTSRWTGSRRTFAPCSSKLGIEELPQYHKRVELARRAIDLGLVTQRDPV